MYTTVCLNVIIDKEVNIKERGLEYTYGGPERYVQGLGGET
jgi:hypothetical protein